MNLLPNSETPNLPVAKVIIPVIPMNILACGVGELARALKTSCFFKLFLLFSKDDGEKRRCARQ